MEIILSVFILGSALCRTVDRYGTVRRVVDGDTFYMHDGNKVRIECIDAPELKQGYGKESALALRNLLKPGTPIVVANPSHDLYKRILGKVIDTRTGRDIGLTMVQNGFAQVYRNKYRKKCGNQYILGQSKAQIRRLGMWASSDVIDPYIFRKQNSRNIY
ncbi:hypothetical protein ACOME3_007880 [Neoechinorhynchus agilis]